MTEVCILTAPNLDWQNIDDEADVSSSSSINQKQDKKIPFQPDVYQTLSMIYSSEFSQYAAERIFLDQQQDCDHLISIYIKWLLKNNDPRLRSGISFGLFAGSTNLNIGLFFSQMFIASFDFSYYGNNLEVFIELVTIIEKLLDIFDNDMKKSRSSINKLT